MKSNTEGWSNQQLNDRIELLEDKLEDIKKLIETGSYPYDDWLDKLMIILEDLE